MSTRTYLAVIGTALMSTVALAQTNNRSAGVEGEILKFHFETIASRNPDFDRSKYIYPADHALAGQVNPNVGDVRLDGVVVNGVTYDRSRLQLVVGARIVTDDAV